MAVLLSDRFAGDPVLTACLNGQHRMLDGESGPAVGKVQQALLDAGYPLSVSGADQLYGAETAAAVVEFKTHRGLTPSDGVVGVKTMLALDTLYLLTEGKRIPPDRTISDRDLVDAANIERISALKLAIAVIRDLKATSEPNPPDENDPTVQALHRFMFTRPDSNFWLTVNAALASLQTNLTTQSRLVIDTSVTDRAHVDETLDPSLGVTIGAPFFEDNSHCQREVVAHEFFHFVVGAQHFYDATTSAEALACPHHLAELVFMIATGEVEGCSKGEVCL